METKFKLSCFPNTYQNSFLPLHNLPLGKGNVVEEKRWKILSSNWKPTSLAVASSGRSNWPFLVQSLTCRETWVVSVLLEGGRDKPNNWWLHEGAEFQQDRSWQSSLWLATNSLELERQEKAWLTLTWPVW